MPVFEEGEGASIVYQHSVFCQHFRDLHFV
jgi:hypothetical protein